MNTPNPSPPLAISRRAIQNCRCFLTWLKTYTYASANPYYVLRLECRGPLESTFVVQGERSRVQSRSERGPSDLEWFEFAWATELYHLRRCCNDDPWYRRQCVVGLTTTEGVEVEPFLHEINPGCKGLALDDEEIQRRGSDSEVIVVARAG